MGGALIGLIYSIAVTFPAAVRLSDSQPQYFDAREYLVYYVVWSLLYGAFVGFVTGLIALGTRGIALLMNRSATSELVGVATGVLFGVELTFVLFLSHDGITNPWLFVPIVGAIAASGLCFLTLLRRFGRVQEQ